MELIHIPTPKRIMTFKQFMAYQEESKKDTSDMNKLVEDSSVDTKNTSDKPLCY